MSNLIEISTLGRQCQYVENYIKCGRLAEFEVDEAISTSVPLRCDEHSIYIEPEVTSHAYTRAYEGEYNGLGY